MAQDDSSDKGQARASASITRAALTSGCDPEHNDPATRSCFDRKSGRSQWKRSPPEEIEERGELMRRHCQIQSDSRLEAIGVLLEELRSLPVENLIEFGRSEE